LAYKSSILFQCALQGHLEQCYQWKQMANRDNQPKIRHIKYRRNIADIIGVVHQRQAQSAMP